jgi:hypothetical protein
MNIDADLGLLKENLDNEIKKLDSRKREDKLKATFVVTYGAFVSGLTTVLIGLSSYLSKYEIFFSIAALVTSASLTVIQAWDKFFNHKKLWIIQAEVLHGYEEIREDISHLEKANRVDQNAINECYERYKKINKNWSTIWMELRLTE